MRFSLIVPVYNAEEYLPGCMESILANDCTDCEIILVDDGSTDGVSPALCDAYAQTHPALVRVIHQANGGPGSARNTGLEAAKGEYVFFVDSDDTIAPESLRVLRQAVEQTHGDIYTFQMATHQPGGEMKPMTIAAPTQRPVYLSERPELLLSPPAIWARIWRRDLFLNTAIRFPVRSWVGEDLCTVPKLLAVASRIVVLPDTLYFYLLRPGSLMRSEHVERNRDMIRAFEDLVGWFREHGLLQQYKKELCYLAVDHLLLASTVRVARANSRSTLLREFPQYMKAEFPDYRGNPYVCAMPCSRKLALWLVEHHCYRLLQVLFAMKDRL